MESAQVNALTPEFARVTLTLLADLTHTNLLGNVHGGVVMRLVDSGRVAPGPAAGAANAR